MHMEDAVLTKAAIPKSWPDCCWMSHGISSIQNIPKLLLPQAGTSETPHRMFFKQINNTSYQAKCRISMFMFRFPSIKTKKTLLHEGGVGCFLDEQLGVFLGPSRFPTGNGVLPCLTEKEARNLFLHVLLHRF